MKRSLGQHILTDRNYVEKIKASLPDLSSFQTVVEIGPGLGAMTEYLTKSGHPNLYFVELDDRFVHILKEKFPLYKDRIIHTDILKLPLDRFCIPPTLMVGNFPYNISSQIIFHMLDYRDLISQCVGLFQKEVAIRLNSGYGNKDYGIITVFLQLYYDTSILFDIPSKAFSPSPRVNSSFISMTRNERKELSCDERLFRQIVKRSFGQRRKMLRNSLKEYIVDVDPIYHELRPEQLSIEDFICICQSVSDG